MIRFLHSLQKIVIISGSVSEIYRICTDYYTTKWDHGIKDADLVIVSYGIYVNTFGFYFFFVNEVCSHRTMQ